MKKKKAENRIVLSCKVKLPKHTSFYLHNLFEGNRCLVNFQLEKLWNEEGFKKVSSNKKAWKSLEPLFERPPSIPSRVFRNSLELSGRIIRSRRGRRELFDLIYPRPCLTLWSEWKIKREFSLSQSPLFILNVKRQVRNLIKEGIRASSYLALERPEFGGDVFLTDADDSVLDGQFKKLKVNEEKIELEIKVPKGTKWVWKKAELETPERVRKLLEEGHTLKAPLFKRDRTHRGEEYYLVLVFEKEWKEKEEQPEKVLSTDLCPSMRRLAVGCVVERSGKVSKPIYFKAEEVVRKVRRLRTEKSYIQRRIDRLYLEKEKTEKEQVKEEIQRKIDHLFKERKLKERKMRNLREEVLEVLVNEIILTAKALGTDTIVIEDLSFREVPEWEDRTLRWLFSTWFYSKFAEKLKEKAKREGIRVREERPANTSRKCFCGREVKKEGHYLVCSVHGHYDRDYLASINLGKRYLKPSALEVGGSPETVPSGGISSSIPSPSTLTAYLRLVYCYFLVSLYSQQLRTRILNSMVKRC